MTDSLLENNSAPVPETGTAPDHQTLTWDEGDMPYSQEFGDHFYCRTDGRLECGHVFLAGNRLPDSFRDKTEFTIGELGFGTGLNFCETWRQFRETGVHGKLHFVSFERFPMQRTDIDRALSHWPEIERERLALCAAWPEEPAGHVALELAPNARLTVVCGAALEQIGGFGETFDAWYLDGFAPSRNPDMWSAELMQLVHDHTRAGGTFATYAAAGFVRRNLQAAGFAVERRKGFAGKREMLCGAKEG